MSAHLCYEERLEIASCISKGKTKAEIARKLNKNKTTIDREIKNHRFLRYKTRLVLECSNYKYCKYGRMCSADCPEFNKFECRRRDISPGACNSCPNYNKCRMNKIIYDPKKAQTEYEQTLVESREGSNTTLPRLKYIGEIIKPLLDKGQSLEQIKLNHPEITESLSTLYKYIDNGLFQCVDIGINNLSLRRKMTRKEAKKRKNDLKKRKSSAYIKGHTYADFEALIASDPDLNIVQMDTVYNQASGPYIQTFKFMTYGFFFAILHEEKTATAMNSGILLLEKILGKELFQQEVQILLTDRGTEFSGLNNLEFYSDGNYRYHVFYCDPMASGQKGSLENKHIELRYIVPNKYTFEELGLTSQAKLNLVSSHLNSCPRNKKLAGKTASELMNFLNPQLFKKFEDFGITMIPKDQVNLTNSLIK